MHSDDFPKGGGDPDVYGYPGEHDATCNINMHGGCGEDCNCNYLKKGATDEDNSNQ